MAGAKTKGKDKGGKAKGKGAVSPEVVSIAAHPRAARAVRSVKAWSGLLGFAVVAFLSWRAGVPPFEVGARALAAGLGLYLAGWAAGVALWRQIVVAELRHDADRRREEREAREAELRDQLEAPAAGAA